MLEYRCLVCGRVFESAQGLRGHLKVHKGQYKTVSFLASGVSYDEFKTLCKVHGLTTCHLFNTFMDAMNQAFKRGAKVEWDPLTENLRAQVGTNPITINLSQNFGARPRGHGKYDLAGAAGAAGGIPRVLCNYFGGVSEGRVYCRNRCYTWLPWERCSGCEYNRA